jgi:hypothetical protein
MIRQVLRLVGRARQWFQTLAARFDRPSRLILVRTDALPERPSSRHLYVVGERGQDWYAALVCPCGCNELIDLNLVPPGRPCWTLTTHRNGSPTLSPSVWRQAGCCAHFWIKEGRIQWVELNRSL